MEWMDEGIVLSARGHGETSAIVRLLTRSHGVHAGLVRGGKGRRHRGVLQPGNRLGVTWRARLSEHLGTYAVEMMHAYAAPFLDDPLRLAALSAACAVCETALAEREPHVRVFDGLAALLESLTGENGPSAYVKWELELLAELGFGLDLSRCAATGGNDQLAYVSPKSGRAVSLSAGEPHQKSLLALPSFLLDGGAGDPSSLADAMKLTGFFLERHVFCHRGGLMPPARRRLAERLLRQIAPFQ